jgi:hypothetical protein
VLWFAACRISCTNICGTEAVLGVGSLLVFAGPLVWEWCGCRGCWLRLSFRNSCRALSSFDCFGIQRCFLLYRAGCCTMSGTGGGARLTLCVSGRASCALACCGGVYAPHNNARACSVLLCILQSHSVHRCLYCQGLRYVCCAVCTPELSLQYRTGGHTIEMMGCSVLSTSERTHPRVMW